MISILINLGFLELYSMNNEQHKDIYKENRKGDGDLGESFVM